MDQFLGVSVALIVFMGMVSGGMLALVLMTTRRHQITFSIILGLAALLALGGVFASATYVSRLAEGLANAAVLLILSSALGYTLTTFSVLSSSNQVKNSPPEDDGGYPGMRTAVILLAPGEPPEYGVRNASKRLALADDPQDVPPVLLRPFYLRDLRSKYASIGRSPYREYYTELARKVQSRLDGSHRVYSAFYSDQPAAAEAIAQAIDGGAERIVIVHVRVTNPPDPVIAGYLLDGLSAQHREVVSGRGKLVELGPLYDSDLLQQIYVRRVLEAVPQVAPGDSSPEDIGLLLVGRGHPNAESGIRSTESGTQLTPRSAFRTPHSGAVRQEQEESFQRRMRQALLKMSPDESRVAHAWLRWQRPSVPEALSSLAAAGCKTVLWMPSSFPADGISTLFDIPALLDSVAIGAWKRSADAWSIKLAPLGAWNADDLAAEDIAARVRAAGEGQVTGQKYHVSGARS